MRDDALYRAVGALETEQEPADPAQTAHLAGLARQMAGLPKTRPARRWKLVLAAAALLALTACAVAAGLSAGWFGSYFPQRDAAQDDMLLKQLGTAIGESKTADGYTVTLLGVISDGYDVVVAFSVIPQEENAASLDSRSNFAENFLIGEERYRQMDAAGQTKNALDPFDWFGAQEIRLEGRPQEGQAGGLRFTARYELRLPAATEGLRESSEKKTFRFALRGLQDGEGRPLSQETWEFTFPLSLGGKRRDLVLEEGSRQGYLLQEVQITPLNLALVWQADGAQQEDEPPQPEGLRLADGSEIFGGQSWCSRSNEGTQAAGASGYKLDKAVDPEQVQAVRIDGKWYDLDRTQTGWALRAAD